MLVKKPFLIFIGLSLVFMFIALILPNILIIRLKVSPLEQCQEVLRSLKFTLDRYYQKFNKYPSSKGDNFFRELKSCEQSGPLPICPGRTGEINWQKIEEEFKKRVDYETWPEGISEKILLAPPDGYPLFWDKRENHKEGRNVLILSKENIRPPPYETSFDRVPTVKYLPVVIFLSEKEFDKYLKKFSFRETELERGR